MGRVGLLLFGRAEVTAGQRTPGTGLGLSGRGDNAGSRESRYHVHGRYPRTINPLVTCHYAFENAGLRRSAIAAEHMMEFSEHLPEPIPMHASHAGR